jgi:thioredoxin 1
MPPPTSCIVYADPVMIAGLETFSSMRTMLELDEGNFEAEVMRSSQATLVDFWAPWCAPCKAIAPHLEAIAEKYEGKVRVGKVDVDENSTLAERFGVRGIPTLIVFRGGEVVGTITGAVPRSRIESLLDELAT